MTDYNQLLNDIATLPDNWNGFGAKKFPDDVINNAKTFLSHVKNIPIMFIVPTAIGAIQFEWELAGIYCEAEVYSGHVDSVDIYIEKNNKEIFDKSFIEIKDAADEFNWMYDNITSMCSIVIPQWNKRWETDDGVFEPGIKCRHLTEDVARFLFKEYDLWYEQLLPCIECGYTIDYGYHIQSNRRLKVEVYDNGEIAGIVTNQKDIIECIDIHTNVDFENLVSVFLDKYTKIDTKAK